MGRRLVFRQLNFSRPAAVDAQKTRPTGGFFVSKWLFTREQVIPGRGRRHVASTRARLAISKVNLLTGFGLIDRTGRTGRTCAALVGITALARHNAVISPTHRVTGRRADTTGFTVEIALTSICFGSWRRPHFIPAPLSAGFDAAITTGRSTRRRIDHLFLVTFDDLIHKHIDRTYTAIGGVQTRRHRGPRHLGV